jgi:signal peptidase II
VIDFLLPACLLLLLDQSSKRIVESHVGDECIAIGPVLRIRYVAGRKGVFSSTPAIVALAVIWLTALASALMLQRSGAWFQSHIEMSALGAAFGGAASNLLDLIRRRHIVDFIDLRWWPVFNPADVAIIGGLVIAFWPRT